MNSSRIALVFVAGVLFCAAAAPSANAQDNQKSKDDGSFSAGVNVSGKADAKDIGVPIFPNSRPHKDKSDDSTAANLGLWGGSVGFKLAVVKMETDAPQEKVAAFYRKALAKYGKVLDCTNAPALTQEQKDANQQTNTLACDDDHAKNGGVIYKSGTLDSQHIVSIEPGAGVATVYDVVNLSTKGLNNK